MTVYGVNLPSPEVRDKIGTASGQYSVFTEQLYSLSIMEYKGGALQLYKNKVPLSIGPASSVGDTTTPEYFFRLPPKTLESRDPFSTVITPTQDNGKYVERVGTIIREVRLTGTTGLRPHRNSPKTIKIFGFDTGIGGPAAQVAEFVGVNNSPDLVGSLKSIADVFTKPSPWKDGEALGYDDITFLRNFFRLFSWLQASTPDAGAYVMLWYNIRDGDYWIVEPVEFTINQDSSSPLTYEYTLSLKLITPYNHVFKLAPDKNGLLKDLRTLFARVDQAMSTIRQSFIYLSRQVDRLAKLPLSFSDTILQPMLAVLDGAEALKTSITRFKATFISSVKSMCDNFRSFANRVKGLFSSDDPAYQAIIRARRAGDGILREPELRPDTVKARIDDAIKAAGSSASIKSPTPGFSGSTGNSNSQILAGSKHSTIKAAVVYPNDTIHTLAIRLLGDAKKYPILVAANSLQAPYVSSKGGLGLLKPGDTILYPAAVTPSSNAVRSQQAGDEVLTYGVDLKLTTSFSGKLDIALNSSKGLLLTSGHDNLIQAIMLKFSVTNGELPWHPNYGALAKIGSKVTASNLASIRLDTQQTILSDPRVESIQSLKFFVSGDMLMVNAKLNIVDTSAALNISLPMRTT